MSIRTPFRPPEYPPARSGPPRVLALAVAAVALLLAGCGSDDDASPPSTTTGIATTEPTSPTTTGASDEPSDDLPGLWVVGPTGLADETGQVWATAAGGEVLRAPTSVATGGVAYLRCAGETPTCKLEVVATAGAAPQQLGDADDLLAAGTVDDRATLLVGATDPTIVPSFEENRSSKVARLVDVESGRTTPVAGWFGWESGPFVAAFVPGHFAACFGEGETCELSTGTDPASMSPVAGAGDPSTVLSLALDDGGERMTWVTAVPMTGAVSVHLADVSAGGEASSIEVRKRSTPPADDVVTDGGWVAVRSGAEVTLWQLSTDGPLELTGNQGTRKVPAETTEITLREPGGGGSGPSIAL